MAVRFDTTSDNLSDGTHPIRTSSGAFTVCCWAKLVNAKSAYWSAIWGLSNNELGFGTGSAGNWLEWWEVTNTLELGVNPSHASDGNVDPDAEGEWVFMAVSYTSTTSRNVYLWTANSGWQSNTSAGTHGIGTCATEYWATYGSTGDEFDGSLAFFRSWTEALTEAQLQAERTKPVPQRTGTTLHRVLRFRNASTAGDDTSSTYGSEHTYNATVNPSASLTDDTDPSYVESENITVNITERQTGPCIIRFGL